MQVAPNLTPLPQLLLNFEAAGNLLVTLSTRSNLCCSLYLDVDYILADFWIVVNYHSNLCGRLVTTFEAKLV